MDHQGHCKVAVGQMTATSDRDANFLTCKRLAQVYSEQIRADCVNTIHGNQVSLIANSSLQMLLCSFHGSFSQNAHAVRLYCRDASFAVPILAVSLHVSLSLSLCHAAHAVSVTPRLLTGHVRGCRPLLLSSVPCCSCRNASALLAETPPK